MALQAAASQYSSKRIIDHITKYEIMPKPTNLYVALFRYSIDGNDNTTDYRVNNGILTDELNYSGYQRQMVTFGTAVSSSNNPTIQSSIANTNTVVFPANTGTTEYVMMWAIMDSLTGGNVLYFSPLLTSIGQVGVIPFETNDYFKISTGNMRIGCR